MIFKQWQEIFDGKKTQTRRVVKQGDEIEYGIPYYDGTGHFNDAPIFAVKRNGRLKWQFGKVYTVVPGRGRPAIYVTSNQHDQLIPIESDALWAQAKTDLFIADGKAHPNAWMQNEVGQPLRIRITAIRQERLQDISEADARAEGYKPGLTVIDNLVPNMPITWYQQLWRSINKTKGTRWEDNPLVFALTFEVAK